MTPHWTPGRFLIATPAGASGQRGFTYRGLGMALIFAGSPKGRRKPKWGLTHLGTGHLVFYITAADSHAFQIATEIADAGDWTFDSLTGWKNQFPDVSEKCAEIMASHPKMISRSGGGVADEGVAREIASLAVPA